MSFMIDAVAGIFADAFNNSPYMSVAVPGKCWHRRAPAEDLGLIRPYAVVTVIGGPKEFITNFSTIQDFLINCSIFGSQSITDTGALATTLRDLVDFSVVDFTRISAKLIGCMPTDEDIDLDPSLKYGQDVIVASCAWALKLHFATRATRPHLLGA